MPQAATETARKAPAETEVAREAVKETEAAREAPKETARKAPKGGAGTKVPPQG